MFYFPLWLETVVSQCNYKDSGEVHTEYYLVSYVELTGSSALGTQFVGSYCTLYSHFDSNADTVNCYF